MGGTDFIENPGHFVHRTSRKVSYMGVLTAAPFQAPPLRPAAGDAEPASGDAASGPPTDSIREKSAAALAAAELAASGIVDPRQDKTQPFEPVSEPLYPRSVEEAAAQAPRWRGG